MASCPVEVLDFTLTVSRLCKEHLVCHPITQVIVPSSQIVFVPADADLHRSLLAKVKLDSSLLSASSSQRISAKSVRDFCIGESVLELNHLVLESRGVRHRYVGRELLCSTSPGPIEALQIDVLIEDVLLNRGRILARDLPDLAVALFWGVTAC